MKLQWLGDIKDVFKFKICFDVIKCLQLQELLWVMMLTPDDNEPYNALSCVSEDLRHYLYRWKYKRLRKDELNDFVWGLKKRVGKVNIGFIKDEFISSNRDNYFCMVRNKVKSRKKNSILILLDPDTGFEPESGAKQEHVRYKEIEELFKEINCKSVLAVFQNMRQGKGYEGTAREIFNCLERYCLKKDSICLYAKKTHALMFLFFKDEEHKQKIIREKFREDNCITLLEL